MGKWATYRHRGGVTVPPAPAFPFSPPAYTAAWTVAPAGGDPLTLHFFSVDSSNPLGVGGIQVQPGLANPPPFNADHQDFIIGDEGDIFTIAEPATVYTRARWIVSPGDPTPLSDWSDVHSTDLG